MAEFLFYEKQDEPEGLSACWVVVIETPGPGTRRGRAASYVAEPGRAR
jgi:hypothetical protein